MSRNRFTRQQADYHHDPRLGRLLLASLGAHLAVVVLFSGVLLPRFARDTRPVYHVDLVNLPVKNPQAGRPDASPEPAKAPAPAAAPEPVKSPPPAPVKPTAQPEAVKIAKPSPPAKKPEVVKTAPKAASYEKEDLSSAIEDMRRRQEIGALKQKLAQLGAKDGRQPAAVPNAPVGSLTGKGTEEGSAWDEWLRTFLKANWSLSKYQVSRLDLEAKVRIVYDSQGNLVDYKFLDPSGDKVFDDSVKKAILLEKQLPKKPSERLEIEVVFNLKELLK